MKVINVDLHNIKALEDKAVLCLGYFDAMHLGHRELVKTALKYSENVGLLTFDRSPKDSIDVITTLEQRVKIAESWGVKFIVVLHFDNELKNVTKDGFMQEVLSKLNADKLVVGEDYRFGKDAKGNIDDLKKKFDTILVDIIKNKDIKISSSSISQMIKDGKVFEASSLLGHYYEVSGEVIYGNQIGRTIGFPTANLKLFDNYVMPALGVYIGKALVKNKEYNAIISVSTHPTIKELSSPIIEVNIDDFDEDIYGSTINIKFIKFINPIEKFDSLDALKDRLHSYKDYLRMNIKKYSLK